MKKLLSIMILSLIASVSFAQLGLSSKSYTKTDSDIKYATKAQVNAKPDTSEVNLRINNVNGYTSVHGIIDSLLTGKYVYNGYRYKMQRDSSIVPTLPNGLISYWKFDESSGSAIDSKAYSTTVAQTAITYDASGKLDRCFTFNGTSSVVNVSPHPEPLTAMTYAFWFKTASTTNGVGFLYNFQNDQGFRCSFAYTSGSSMGIEFFLGAGSPTFDHTTSHVVINNNAWHHCMFVWNGTTTYAYIDNVQVGTWAYSTPISFQAGSDLRIGGYTSGRYMAGSMDEIGFWNRALTSTERTTLYNAGTGKTYPF